MRVVTEFPYEVMVEEDVGIVMPDGCRLSARIWRAVGAGAVPAVLEYIPYRKRDGTRGRDARMHPYFAGHGYAAVRVDMRGNGDSEGLMTDEYTAQELQDACDVIAWLAAQEWCSGSVGMMGKSWGGFNCLQTAFLQPPALKAVVAVCSTTDRFADDIHFKGGCLLGENLGWGAVMLSYSSRPADRVLRADWREDWLARLEAEPFLAPRWAGHQARDAYWKHGSICEDFSRIEVPVLSFSGWADNYMNTSAHLVRGVAGAKAIVGPWVHQYPHQAVPGPAIGFLDEALRWWDRWLKGVENGAEADPAYRVWMMDSAPPDASTKDRAGRWVAEDALPSARVMVQELALTAGGVLGGSGGALATAVCTRPDLGLTAGEFFPMGLNAEMPGDQAPDDALSVCFDGTVLDAPLALLGAARLRLRLRSDQPRAFIVARLCDVAPNGQSVRIAHGMLNLCHRDSMEQPCRLTPGEAVTAEVVLDDMAYCLAAGHHLRLALSTTYFPFLVPSPVAATLTLLEGRLALPVHEGAHEGPAHEGAGEWVPPPPTSAKPINCRFLTPANAARRVETDLLSGRVALVVEDGSGRIEYLDHGLITAEDMVERFEVDPADPSHAVTRIVWEQSLSRQGKAGNAAGTTAGGDWAIRTQAVAQMRSTPEALVFHATLRAWDGETLVFERAFNESVPRDFV
ncbi:CocE/NonD family hydrolase [Pseudorhodobacter ferrugineus]|uniref:CocE/NonD family hydrolase n=1 Tax=Pseudorhodobacter ferrugineus TaxID=77008 RepID=UPI0003B4430A|nr:CocE/NonD family hydrolase [Pseudorhodobacter ferrugineus]